MSLWLKANLPCTLKAGKDGYCPFHRKLIRQGKARPPDKEYL